VTHQQWIWASVRADLDASGIVQLLNRRMKVLENAIKHMGLQIEELEANHGSWPYRWTNSTAVADPGSGRIGVNNANPSLATILIVSALDKNDQFALPLASLTAGANIAAYNGDALNQFVKYQVTGPPVDHGGVWLEVPVSLVQLVGFAPTNNDLVQFFMP